MQNFGATNKEHYGMLWYFLEWSIVYSYFEKGSRKNLHVTIPKGIVGGFEFTVFQRNLKEWQERPWTVCLRVLKKSNKSRFDSYSR